MGREKRKLPAPVAGGPKERHKRALRSQYDPTAPVPQGLVAKPAIPKSKHHTYFEFVENKDKKKKLEFQITSRKTPPPGFEFVPIGNPELTTACKELSRTKDAMIFIVSNSKEVDSNQLAHQVHRIGHHIRQVIVEEARKELGQSLVGAAQVFGGSPEPIPESQEEYNAQVDAAIRDLFPRIPNTDRQMIIEHAFRRGSTFKGEKPVGLSADITLARRVQLAVLAHIRHNHTRYDTLLKETTWQNARKVVEGLCLDTLVKWRGDEETGRDQLDEILREVVVISDSEDEDSDEETDDSFVEEISQPTPGAILPNRTAFNTPGQTSPQRRQEPKPSQNGNHSLMPARPKAKVKKGNSKNAPGRMERRGFKRYNAWQEALRRYRGEQDPDHAPPMDRSPDHEMEPYHQLATRRAAPPHPPTTIDPGSRPRIISDEAAGPAPSANGYVRQSPMHGRPQLHPAPHSFPLAPRQPPYEKVTSPIHELSPNVLSPGGPVSINNPFKDMLVRSIEPASPGAMGPSFVRAVPPRTQVYRDDSPVRSSMQHSPMVLSPSRPPVLRDGPPYPRRRVASDHFSPGARISTDYHYDAGAPISDIRNREEYPPSQVRHMVPIPSHQLGPRPGESSYPIRPATPQPLYGSSPRPGDRSNPILMEDRGSFYERIPSHPDRTRPPLRDVEVMQMRRSDHDWMVAPEPHRVVSWEEGSRILRESQGQAGVEIIPIPSRRPIMAEPRSRTPLIDPPFIQLRSSDHRSRVRIISREPHPVYFHRPGPDTRPVSGEPSAYRYAPSDDMRQNERQTAPLYNDRRYERDTTMEGQEFPPQPRYPPPAHHPENVIVLE